MDNIFINDGHTRTEKVEYAAGKSFDITFRYAVAEEVEAYLAMTKGLEDGRVNARQYADYCVKLLLSKLVSWTAPDGTGASAQLNEQNLRRLPFPIHNRLLNAVTDWKSEAAEAKN